MTLAGLLDAKGARDDIGRNDQRVGTVTGDLPNAVDRANPSKRQDQVRNIALG
jgi:hypothetical protein